jgi:hypothetical protein
VALVGEISKALVDLGLPPLPPIQGITQDPGRARDILEATRVILELLQAAYASSTGHWD